MVILELLKKIKKKESSKTIRKLLKKEGFISKPPVETYKLSEDQE